jgi:GT2 family glycosyltransferase
MTSKEVVIISSWRRANYLRQCLNALCHARGVNDREVWIFQNDRDDPGVDLMPVYDVIDNFIIEFENIRIITQNCDGWRLAHDQAWQAVYKSDAPRVYFFSDDVVCTPDFFEWHDAVQADGDWWGSTAWRHPAGQTKPYDLEAYYQIGFPNEISMGLCVKRSSILAMLQSTPCWPSQERMQQEDWKIVMPYVQRCFHIGRTSSHLESVGENMGPAIDMLPNLIPDYGRQTVVLKS